VLLTHHARLGRWLQTGGHLEPTDRDLTGAAAREAAEESGLSGLVTDADPLLLSAHALPPTVPCAAGGPMTHLDVQHLVLADAADPPVVSAESTAVRWFEVNRLPEVDASVRALVAAAGRRLDW
jgi:8-oxo-dGTP pyrophosphatase MutT (NUDIX family)